MDTPLPVFGYDLFGRANDGPTAAGVLAKRFLMPPFSVLDARSGVWQDRKHAWLTTGIKSEVGRDVKAYNIGLSGLANNEWTTDTVPGAGFGTSIFDPVLCECAYRWFSAPGDHVLDPFAGGSVRGLVATDLARRYTGIDLSAAQIAANRAQVRANGSPPTWICADSMEYLPPVNHEPWADMVFTCPPYGDLEVYSADPKDISGMEWHTFAAAYSRIVLRAVAALRQDRFACVVVGDFRDGRGILRDFVSLTIAAFRAAGAQYYNEAILVTPTGSAAVRATKQFAVSRKLCKTHQNVLVFVKGDPRAATARLPDVP